MSTQIGRNVDFYHTKSRKRIPGGKMEEKRDIIIPRADKNSWITLPMRD